MDLSGFSPLARQIFVISGTLSTILGCGLGLGHLTVLLDEDNLRRYNESFVISDNDAYYIDIAGEIAFLPAIVIPQILMQKKGHRTASFTTILPLLLGWIVMLFGKSFSLCICVNILHSLAIGGAISISSVIVSELCAPKFRGTFLMLETVMLSLGILISHICEIFFRITIVPYLGIISALYSIFVTYYLVDSPYWLINRGQVVKASKVFYWLRGKDEESINEINALLMKHKMRIRNVGFRPVLNISLRDRILTCVKTLVKSEFLKPLSIMILLFSFVGFGGETLVTKFSLHNLINMTNGKYIGTIILDVITLICSLTACVLIQLIKRKTLFIFTGSISIIMLSFTSLILFLQTLGMIAPEYLWLLFTFVTLFAMFMSLGTTALPLSLIGEIFPMSYKGIGSSLTIAYLWAFGNSVLRFAPELSLIVGLHGMLFIFIVCMVIILMILKNVMPEISNKTLLEIEQYTNVNLHVDSDVYDIVIENDDENDKFDKLRLLID